MAFVEYVTSVVKIREIVLPETNVFCDVLTLKIYFKYLQKNFQECQLQMFAKVLNN